MNIEIANAMYGYFETLYIMNQNLIKLCGAEIFYYRFSEFEKLTLDIIQDIPRLVPYSYDNKKQDLNLDNSNGLLEYQAEIKYIKEDYQNILDKYKEPAFSRLHPRGYLVRFTIENEQQVRRILQILSGKSYDSYEKTGGHLYRGVL